MSANVRYVPLAELITDAKAGFACGEEDADGVFQIRMNNVTAVGDLDLSKRRRVPGDHKSVSTKKLQAGDVLFNATNSPDLVGKTAIVCGIDEVTTYSNHFLRLRTDPTRLVPAYLAYWLQSQFRAGVFKSLCRQWVNQATVGRESLLRLAMPVPSISEQMDIVANLDSVKAIRLRRRDSIALLDDLSHSCFMALFGDGIAEKSWPCLPLGDIVRAGTIVTYGIVQAGDEYPGGVPYIRTGDIKDGSILSTQLRRTSPEIAARFTRSRVEVGDIVMSIRATVGTTAPVTAQCDGANLTQGTARISPGKFTNHLFLLHYLRSKKAQDWIKRQVKGATFHEITLSKLRELAVHLPPMQLQEEFDRRISAVDRMRSTQLAHLATLDILFASLQHGAFRG